MFDNPPRETVARIVHDHNKVMASVAFIIAATVMIGLLMGVAPVGPDHAGTVTAQSTGPFELWNVSNSELTDSAGQTLVPRGTRLYVESTTAVDIIAADDGSVRGSTKSLSSGDIADIGVTGTAVYGSDPPGEQLVKAQAGVDGEVQWQNGTYHDDEPSGVAVDDDGTVYSGGTGFVNGDPRLVAVDGDTQKREWNHSHHSGKIAHVEHDNGVVFSGSSSGKVVAAAASDGSQSWSATPVSAVGDLVVTDNDTVLIAPQSGSTVYAYNQSNGNEVWNTSVTGTSIDGLGYDNGQMYVGRSDDVVEAIDTQSKNSTWTWQAPAFIIDISADNGRIYIKHGDGIDALIGSASVVGTVRDTTGQPLANTRVEINGTVDQTDISGEFSVPVGGTTGDTVVVNVSREGYINETESVTLAGATTTENFNLTEARMTFNSPQYLRHGQESGYTVTAILGNETRTNVTDEAFVTSTNTSVVTVDEQRQVLVATNDTNVNRRVDVVAQWDDPDGDTRVEEQEVTVSNSTVENFDILPPVWQINAVMSDSSIQIILVALLLAVAATLFSTSFAGLSIGTLTIIVGWLGGWADTGLVLTAIALAAFIGLNLAANIDYSVRTG